MRVYICDEDISQFTFSHIKYKIVLNKKNCFMISAKVISNNL